MVGIEGVAETERVGERSGGNEGWVEAQDDGGGDPDGDVDGDEEGDGADTVGGDAGEEFRFGRQMPEEVGP